MSNIYDAEFESRLAQAAGTRAIEGLDYDQQEAARSARLERIFGTPATVINGDLEGFERQQKTALIHEMVRNNPTIQDYINGNPMAARVSQDDYPQLDEWHRKAREFTAPVPEGGRIESALAQVVQSFSSVFAAIPKQVAITSRATAEGRLEGLEGLQPQEQSVDDSPEARAAFRLRRGQLKLTPEQIAERKTGLEARTAAPVEEDPFYVVGTAIEDFFKWLAPTNKDYQGEFFASKLPSAIGSMIGFIAGGALLRAVRAPAGEAAIPLPFAIGTLGATSQSVEQFEDAINHGASIPDALSASGFGAIIGTSEALPIVHFLDRLDKATGGQAKRAVLNILKQGLEEGIQEFGQKVSSNVVANRIVGYDPSRGTLTGAADDASVGFAAGVLMQTLAEMVGGKRGRGGQSPGQQAAQRVRLVNTYLQNGEVPPPGVDNFVDAAHILAAKEDAKLFREVMSAAQKSQTRELAPELAESFARKSVGNAEIGISPTAIDALYGDERPAPDDGKLGFIEDLWEQLQIARQTGVDVQVSLAKLMAHGDPQVVKELEEFVRFRPGGITLKEAEAIKKAEEEDRQLRAMIDAWHGSPHTFDVWGMNEGQPVETALTGEGAASYGHPLKGGYFADVRETSESYQKNLGKGSGALYRTRLHVNKEDLLDWDKRLSEQSPRVQEKLKSFGFEFDSIFGEKAYRDLGNKLASKEFQRTGKSASAMADILSSQALLDAGIPGIKYLDQGSRAPNLEYINGIKETKKKFEDRIATEELDLKLREQLEARIEEINQEIRKAENPTYNYVIFDPKLIQILERNGEAIRQAEDAEQIARDEAGLEHYANALRKEVRIEKVSEAVDPRFPKDPPFSTYHIFDEMGNKVGDIEVQLTPKNVLYVPWIGGYTPGASKKKQQIGQPHVFGLHSTESLFRQLAKEYPTATHVGGYRVSGARTADPKWVQVPMRWFKEKPQEGAEFLASLQGLQQEALAEEVPEGTIEAEIEGATIQYRPTELLSSKEQEIVAAVTRIAQQVVPGIPVATLDRIFVEAGGMEAKAEVQGAYVPGRKIASTFILVSMQEPDAVGTLLHEAIHHLKRGFFTKEEWATLEATARNEGWIDKHNIRERYSKASEELMLEESIAEAYRYWFRAEAQGGEGKGPVAPAEAVTLFERLRQFFAEIKAQLEEYFGKGITADKLFTQVSTGEIGQRKPGTYMRRGRELGPLAQGKSQEELRKQYERQFYKLGYDRASRGNYEPLFYGPDETTLQLNDFEDGGQELVDKEQAKRDKLKEIYERGQEDAKAGRPPEDEDQQIRAMAADATSQEEKELFSRGQALGLTQRQYERLMTLLERRQAEIEARARARAEKAADITNTQEWKDALPQAREDAEASINSRPDVLADEYFRKGLFFGQKREGPRVTIGRKYLTEEQQAQLGNNILSKNGVDPMDIGWLLGFQSKDEMIGAMINLHTVRKDLGLTQEAFKQRITADATIEIMNDRVLTPKMAEALQDAREDILTETQMDLLHEELIAAGMKAGVEIPLSKQDIVDAAKVQFLDIPVTRAEKMEMWLKEAGKAGNEAFTRLLAGDYAEALRQKQRQVLNVMFANEAKALKKQRKALERQAKRFEPREVKGVDHDFTNFIKMILQQGGFEVNRTSEEMIEIAGLGGHRDLQQFVDQASAFGWEMAVSDDIAAGRFGEVDKMTVGQFNEFKDAIDSMATAGKRSAQVELIGGARDFDDWKQEVLQNIRQLPKRGKKGQGNLAYSFDAILTRMEEMAKDLDLRQENGPLQQALIHSTSDAKHTEYTLTTKLIEDLESLKEFQGKWRRTLKDEIPNNFLIDPYTDAPFNMTREQMINIMLNFGNKSNIEKFTKGYVPYRQIPGETAKDRKTRIAQEAQVLEAQLRRMFDQHATAEDWKFVQGVWDIFAGWQPKINELYYELSGVAPKMVQAQAVDTPHGRFRGGYFPIIWDELNSRPHGAEPTYAPGALISQGYFRATTSNHYTKERTNHVDRVAFEDVSERIGSRIQQVIHDLSYRRAILNINKIIFDDDIREAITKHYGKEYADQLEPWAKDMANHYNADEKKLAVVNKIVRGMRLNLVAHVIPLNLKTLLTPDVGLLNPVAVAKALFAPREAIQLAHEKSKEIPHTLQNMDRDFRERLEQMIKTNKWDSFRSAAVRFGYIPVMKLSQAFRIVTFNDVYKDAIGRGLNEGEAVALADSAVRTRHGAHGLPDMPAIMRGNEWVKAATMFYGYFNTMHNWRRQLPNAVRQQEWQEAMKIIYGSTLIGAGFGMLFYNKGVGDDDDSPWYKLIGGFIKANALEIAGGFPMVREVANYFLEAQTPKTPLGGLIESVDLAAKDVKRAIEGKEVKAPIRHAANVIGPGFGLPLGQVGRTAQGLRDVQTGSKDPPRNFLEWMKLIIFGEVEEKRRRR